MFGGDLPDKLPANRKDLSLVCESPAALRLDNLPNGRT